MDDAGARRLEGAPIANEIRTAVAEDVATYLLSVLGKSFSVGAVPLKKKQRLGIALARELLAADALSDGRLVQLAPQSLADDAVYAYWIAYPGALAETRRLKPSLPQLGFDGIPLRDELALELLLDAPQPNVPLAESRLASL